MNIISLLYTVHKRVIFHLAKWYMRIKILLYEKSVIFHPKTCYIPFISLVYYMDTISIFH
jgi:hypothetical protein